MGYIDSRKILSLTDEFLASIGKKSEVDSARSFFESKMSNLGRSFDTGEVQRGELAEKVSELLKSFKIYLRSDELRALDKKFQYA